MQRDYTEKETETETRGVTVKKEVGDEVTKLGTKDTRLRYNVYEMTIETVMMNHFMQTSKGTLPPPSSPHYTPVH